MNTFALERSNAEVVSSDGACIYLAHSGVTGDTAGSWISVVIAEGATVAVVPVDGHATDMGLSPDGSGFTSRLAEAILVRIGAD